MQCLISSTELQGDLSELIKKSRLAYEKFNFKLRCKGKVTKSERLPSIGVKSSAIRLAPSVNGSRQLSIRPSEVYLECSMSNTITTRWEFLHPSTSRTQVTNMVLVLPRTTVDPPALPNRSFTSILCRRIALTAISTAPESSSTTRCTDCERSPRGLYVWHLVYSCGETS